MRRLVLIKVRLRCLPVVQMAEPPKQKCDLSREEAETKLKAAYTDFCPLCKELGVDVRIGFHKSRDVPPGQFQLSTYTCVG